jgi:hypothetical protein
MAPIAADEGDEIVHLRIKFPPDTPDVEWLGFLGDDREWVVVSCDAFNKTDEEKKEIVKRARCTFVLSKGYGNLKFWILASKVLMRWPDIREKAEHCRLGAVYKVTPTSSKIDDITANYL